MKLILLLLFASYTLGASQILSVEQLQAVLGDVEILDFSKYAVPEGQLEFSKSGLSSSGFWRGRVLYGENRSTAVWAKIRVAAAGDERVNRGDDVKVEVHSGGVLLTFNGIAESTGHTGGSVIVKNPENGRRFSAKVEGRGKVSVKK